MSMLPDADFVFIAREVKSRSGLVLDAEQAYLIETRLSPIARRESLGSVAELATAARLRRDERLIWQITDALLTSETTFFRDRAPFQTLRDRVIPELQRARAGEKIRIWCAASSTGQEPFSIAMMIDEMRAEGRGGDIEIVATDISERVLEKARAGLYSQFEVQRGLPISMLLRHFEKAGELWRIADRIRAMIRFQRFNLLDDIKPLGRFDIVLCRNVLPYFDPATKQGTLEKIAAQMSDDGVLLLGAGETTGNVTDAFTGSGFGAGFHTRNIAARAAA
jgi:chemotaxis protein methyltransferase CheR